MIINKVGIMLFITVIFTMLLTIPFGILTGYCLAYNKDKKYHKLLDEYNELAKLNSRNVEKYNKTLISQRYALDNGFHNKAIEELQQAIKLIEDAKSNKERR